MPHALRTLGDGVYWARSHWTGREVPARLHDGNLDPDGAPRTTAAFLRYLTAQPWDVTTVSERDVCYHPQLPRDRAGNITTVLVRCTDCDGTGTRVRNAERYRYPMWRALRRLERIEAIRPRQPRPIELIAALVISAWDGRAAARLLGVSWDAGEALLVMALRKLYDRYELGPLPRTSWVDLSESQRNAVEAVA